MPIIVQSPLDLYNHISQVIDDVIPLIESLPSQNFIKVELVDFVGVNDFVDFDLVFPPHLHIMLLVHLVPVRKPILKPVRYLEPWIVLVKQFVPDGDNP